MNVIKLSKISVMAALMGMLLSTSVFAAQIVIDPGLTDRDDFTGSVGIEFTVGASDALRLTKNEEIREKF